MDYEKTFQILEEINRELKDVYNSKEYKRGINVIHSFEEKNRIKNIYNIIRTKIVCNIAEKKYNVMCKEHRINRKKVDKDKKVIIYTCITGNYDEILEPYLVYDKNVKYILFTDSEYLLNKADTNWEIREIPENVKKYNNTLINRYIKLHAYEIFADECDFCIYIDGNIRLVGDPFSFLGSAKDSVVGIGMYVHNCRDCVYAEAKVCQLFRKGNKKKINEQICRYRQEGFPEHFGLREATVIVSDMANVTGRMIFDKWWEELIFSSSNRDQLALPYVVWKNNISFDDFGFLGNDVGNDVRIQKYQHI